MRKAIYIMYNFLIILVLYQNVIAEDIPPIAWTVIDSQYGRIGSAIAVDNNDNSFVTGETFEHYCWIQKFDSEGKSCWGPNIVSTNNAAGYGIAVDVNGDFYITGEMDCNNTENRIFIKKYNTNGNILWTELVDTPIYGDDYGMGIAVDNSCVYVTGGQMFEPEGNFWFNWHCWTNKYSINGNQLTGWPKTYPDQIPDGIDHVDYWGTGIALDSNGDIYIIGQKYNMIESETFDGSVDIFVRKYDTNGNLCWNQIIDGSEHINDYSGGIAVDRNNNAYITGSVDNKFWLRKHSANGGIFWTRPDENEININYGSNGGIAVDINGNVYITVGSDLGASIRKYDTDGNQIWNKTLGGANGDYSNGVAVDSSGNSYITGYTSSNAYYTVKYNSSGSHVWNLTDANGYIAY